VALLAPVRFGHFLPRAVAGLRRWRQKEIEQTVVDALVREVLDFRLTFTAHHVDRALHEIANHPLDVPSDVADLGELRRLDLDERRAGELRESPRNFRLTNTRGSDENDVIGADLFPNRLRRPLTPPAIAQRDRDCLLRVRLADDIPIELGDDLL